ncbi:esterase [Marmoricola endophyticus]|uniref:Esterase n=1 Tax=Marmoricola endophyticus TaxID=2040280 RepID=A0A917B8K4_9ACTN|nr:alpha/beta fold hydrolase [Marmoricola endophyticus]GGF31597.1 esterase [Marmoricola endophyticus]
MPLHDPEPFTAPGRPDASGRTTGVLLCHGFTGSPGSMNPWGRHLAAQGFAVSVPLLPGHGTTWQEMNRTGYDQWYAALDSAYDELRSRTDVVVVGGLSMGGGLSLLLAARHPRDVAGVMVVNAAVSSQNKQLLAVPLLKWVLGSMPGLGGDIKKPGVAESAYDRVPLKALHSMVQGWRQVRAALPEVTQPLLVWRSREDHVVDEQSTRDILAGVSSRDVEEHVLEDSYHVATLDNDAELVFAESVDFVRRVTG